MRDFIEVLFTEENQNLQRLDYIFCSDEYLLGINNAFLQHNYYTDIISFDLSADKGSTMGEIYISTDRVKDNAQLLAINYETEFLRVLVHGALHLCGYKDKTTKDTKLMRLKEDNYIKLYSQL